MKPNNHCHYDEQVENNTIMKVNNAQHPKTGIILKLKMKWHHGIIQ
jgi:hypothetical protein